MKFASLFAFAAVACSEQSHSDEFSVWQRKFNKKYIAAELKHRREVFAANMKIVKGHNLQHAAGNVTWFMGLNQFSDLTPDEFKKYHLSTFNSTRTRKPTLLAPTPLDGVDWRTKGAVTPVKNQGQCGSCWSFSTTGSTEGAWQIAGHNLTSLSEQQLMDCSTKEGDHSCQGGLMDYGFQYIIDNNGIDTEADYPYKERNGNCDAQKEKNVAARITAFHDVPQNDASQLAAAIAKGPVSVAIEADQSGFQNYAGGVFDGVCGTKLDHGVLAVGYSPDYWIVKNSWGETWGDQGYIKISRSSGVPVGNLCGILQAASYPVAQTGPLPPSPPPPPPTPPTPGPGQYTYVLEEKFSDPECTNSSGASDKRFVGTCYSSPIGGDYFSFACDSSGQDITTNTYYQAPTCQGNYEKRTDLAGLCMGSPSGEYFTKRTCH